MICLVLAMSNHLCNINLMSGAAFRFFSANLKIIHFLFMKRFQKGFFKRLNFLEGLQQYFTFMYIVLIKMIQFFRNTMYKPWIFPARPCDDLLSSLFTFSVFASLHPTKFSAYLGMSSSYTFNTRLQQCTIAQRRQKNRN